MSTTATTAPVGSSAAAESERRADLARMKQRATGLLVLVAAAWLILLITTEDVGWAGYAIAAAEAGMVGGLADWFAVTAVFRHPLGLPIPHTAVVAARKDQFGETLGQFVQENFLAPEVVGEQLRRADIARRLGAVLVVPDTAETVAGHVAEFLGRVARNARDDDAISLIETEVRRRLNTLDVAPTVGRFLEVLTVGGHHEELLDELLGVLDTFLLESEPALRDRFVADAPWWLPEPIDDVIFQRLFTGVRNILAGAATPGEDGDGVREQIHASVDDFVTRLRYDPVLIQRAEELKQDLLQSEQVRQWVSAVWEEIKGRLQAEAAQPESVLRARLTSGVVSAGQRLVDDDATADRVNQLAVQAARAGAEQFKDELAALVSETVSRWDSEETSDRLELLLGRDLQFIRINGTVVGAAAGLVIHLVSQLTG
ncbi:DUF445 domain-containing protein [Euzebya tangerina]|uniref:DUF445 domain-containing protein n=1 Tax=Euzebya tangerina TaxID=591198 RepID=UPI0013C2FF0F|nr:DUF445 domain-containing protein [Euzebya tangerina]